MSVAFGLLTLANISVMWALALGSGLKACYQLGVSFALCFGSARLVFAVAKFRIL
jgi:hypothetical protein